MAIVTPLKVDNVTTPGELSRFQTGDEMPLAFLGRITSALVNSPIATGDQPEAALNKLQGQISAASSFLVTIGNGADTIYNVAHNLNTLDVRVIVMRGSVQISPRWLVIDANTVSVPFALPIS